MSFYYGNTIHLLFSLRSFRKHRKSSSTLKVAVQIDRLIVNQLPEYWKGASADKAQSTYAEEYKNFLQKKVPEMVTALKDYMQDCVKNITDVDNQLAGR